MVFLEAFIAIEIFSITLLIKFKKYLKILGIFYLPKNLFAFEKYKEKKWKPI